MLIWIHDGFEVPKDDLNICFFNLNFYSFKAPNFARP